MPLVTDDMVETALRWLTESDNDAGASRGAYVRAEYNRKATRARLMLNAPDEYAKSAAMREAYAESHRDYAAACDAEARAAEADERCRDMRNRAAAILDAWRTEQANARAGRDFR